MTFFEICLDEISYGTPYLQVCTKKSVCKYFFPREISSAAPTRMLLCVLLYTPQNVTQHLIGV